MPLVYIVNQPQTHSLRTGRMETSQRLSAWTRRVENTFDVSPAAAYGELCHLLPPGMMANDLEYVRDKIERGLAKMTAEDWLVPIGNPIAIMIAGAIAARNTGRLNVLRWHSRSFSYEPMSVGFPSQSANCISRSVA